MKGGLHGLPRHAHAHVLSPQPTHLILLSFNSPAQKTRSSEQKERKKQSIRGHAYEQRCAPPVGTTSGLIVGRMVPGQPPLAFQATLANCAWQPTRDFRGLFDPSQGRPHHAVRVLQYPLFFGGAIFFGCGTMRLLLVRHAENGVNMVIARLEVCPNTLAISRAPLADVPRDDYSNSPSLHTAAACSCRLHVLIADFDCVRSRMLMA